jgi:hypothetical protein
MFSMGSYAGEIAKITFNENLEERIKSDEIIDIRVGTRTIEEEVAFNRDVTMQNSFNGGGGVNIYVAEIKAEANRQYSYNFGQITTRRDSTAINSKECKKVRVVTKYFIRKGKVIDLHGEEFKFEIIDKARVETFPIDCSSSNSSSSSTQSTSTSKWFSPTKKKVTWKKAKQVCRDNGGRLPTIEELKEVVTDCRGIINESNKNIVNSSYQACYKRKGFTSNYYWSSTTDASNSSNAWSVHFYNGFDGWDDKGFEIYVRCVRGGQ